MGNLRAPVEIWHASPLEIADDALRAICLPLLTKEDRARHQAFVFDKHKHEFLVTRALCLGVLGRTLAVGPSELAFQKNHYGRPELVPPASLRFNLTNTTGLVACAVVPEREVGVDVEALDRADTILGLVDTVFTRAERANLAALDLPARRRRAVDLWTLKESYMKARGMGMSLPVERIELSFDGPLVSVSLLEGMDPDPHRWAFSRHDIDGHVVSLCVELRDDEPGVVVRKADLRELLDGA